MLFSSWSCLLVFLSRVPFAAILSSSYFLNLIYEIKLCALKYPFVVSDHYLFALVVAVFLSNQQLQSMSFLDTVTATAKANPYTIGAAVLGGVGAVAYLALRPSQKQKKAERKPGVVYLNILGRTAWSPNSSPFGIKLETWLRMTDIKYEVMEKGAFSKKGKTPWIEYNGKAVAELYH